MGVITIACYRPKPGKEEALRQIVKEHVPILRAEKLATDRVSHVMTCRDGTIDRFLAFHRSFPMRVTSRRRGAGASWSSFVSTFGTAESDRPVRRGGAGAGTQLRAR